MRDYALLAKAFRHCEAKKPCGDCPMYGECPDIECRKNAADAIEELLARVSDTDVGKCKDCATQHIDPDGMRWCEELSMIVADDFYCGYWGKPAPPKGVE